MENLIVYNTVICEECGEEIKSGILNLCDHLEVCKRNAPNKNIDHHRYVEAMDRILKRKKTEIDLLLRKMTKEESEKLSEIQLLPMIRGYHTSQSTKEESDFLNEMRLKYKNAPVRKMKVCK